MSTKATKLALIAGAIIVFVLLFIAPKTNLAAFNAKKESSSGQTKSFDVNANLDFYLQNAVKTLPADLKSSYDAFYQKQHYDSLINFWLTQKRPDLAACFEEKKALKINTDSSALKCGNRYYYSVQFTKDQTEAPVLFACAAKMYNKALSINPNNFDAKLMLASCYLEASSSPMDGIALLRELEKADSNNVKLQLTFAFFSLKSGQNEKALQRFNKALKIDSSNIEIYLHLADVHERLGNLEQTKLALMQYAKRTKDLTSKLEIEKYIQQLEK